MMTGPLAGHQSVGGSWKGGGGENPKAPKMHFACIIISRKMCNTVLKKSQISIFEIISLYFSQL